MPDPEDPHSQRSPIPTYPSSSTPIRTSCSYPPVRSITLILHNCDPIAFTTGKEIDDEHKEIHLKLDYLASIEPERLRSEILGVVTHEMVHCWQWSNNAPGGPIEGIADWVRLDAGLAPKGAKRKKMEKWDQGYMDTAFFLDWLETDRCGQGTVRALNGWIGKRAYQEDEIWWEICGARVDQLWLDYQDWVRKR